MLDLDRMDDATQHRIVEGTLVFFDQVGVYPPIEAWEASTSTPCPVCGGGQPADDMHGPCSAECYYAWTHSEMDDDPRERGWA